jgi:hypothetical protein
MPAYRFHLLESDGHIVGPPLVVEFPDDHAVIKAAEAILDGKTIEVWDQERVVIRLAPKQPRS